MNETETEYTEDMIRWRWIEVLAVVYRAADWSQITGGGQRRATDVFQHRLQVASKQTTVPQAVRKLCHGLSLQGPELPTAALDELRSQERRSLRLLDDENVYLTLKAKETVQSYYDSRSDEGDEGSAGASIRETELSRYVDL